MTDAPPTDPVVEALQAELALVKADVEKWKTRAFSPPLVLRDTQINTEYELLGTEARRAIADGVKIGGSVLAVLGLASAVLPALHLPAGDLGELTAISAAVSAFMSWAARRGITAQAAKK